MDNEPWSQDLLDWLASDFVATGNDIKKLIFKILTSQTYQLPSVGVKEAELIVAPDYVFTGMLRRRLTAEQFTDAVSLAIQPVYGDTLVVYKLLPTSIKKNIPFARASLVKNDPFLTALGRPNRETVSTSRTSQAIYYKHSSSRTVHNLMKPSDVVQECGRKNIPMQAS